MLIPRTRYQDYPLNFEAPPAVIGGKSGSLNGTDAADVLAKIASLKETAYTPSTTVPGYTETIVQMMNDVVNTDMPGIIKAGGFRPPSSALKVLTTKPTMRCSLDIEIVTRPAPASFGRFNSSFLFHKGYFDVVVPSPMKIATTADVNALQIDAMAKLKAAGMDYLTTVAEFRETVAMFTGLKSTIQDRIAATTRAWEKDLKQKRRGGKFKGFHSLKEGFESFSNFWLQYRFGWRIFAYDVQSVYDYFERKDDGVKLFTRRSRDEFESTNKSLLYSRGNSLMGHYEVWGKTTYTEKVGVGYSAFVDQSVLGNPMVLNTLWDITPWTVVADMLFNVQDNIIAMSQFPIGVDLIANSGFVSRSADVTFEVLDPKFIPGSLPTGTNSATMETSGFGINTSYIRDTAGSPHWDVTFQPNLDFSKVIDLITLALPMSRVIRRFLK